MTYEYIYRPDSAAVKQAAQRLNNRMDSSEYSKGVQWWQWFIQQRLNDGDLDDDIVAHMSKCGVESSLAQELLTQVKNSRQVQRPTSRRNQVTWGIVNVVWGLVLFVAGTAITIGSFATRSGGMLWLWWGAIIGGPIFVWAGLQKIRGR